MNKAQRQHGSRQFFSVCSLDCFQPKHSFWCRRVNSFYIFVYLDAGDYINWLFTSYRATVHQRAVPHFCVKGNGPSVNRICGGRCPFLFSLLIYCVFHNAHFVFVLSSFVLWWLSVSTNRWLFPQGVLCCPRCAPSAFKKVLISCVPALDASLLRSWLSCRQRSAQVLLRVWSTVNLFEFFPPRINDPSDPIPIRSMTILAILWSHTQFSPTSYRNDPPSTSSPRHPVKWRENNATRTRYPGSHSRQSRCPWAPKSATMEHAL